MSRDYKEIRNEICSIMGKNKVLSFSEKLVPAPNYNYASILDDRNSKIALMIQDYQKGTGDQSTFVNFNLSLMDVEMLYYYTNNIHMVKEPIYLNRIYGNNPDENGECLCFHLQIKYDGSRRFPWSIVLSNGKAKATKNALGGFNETPKSFRQERYVGINVSMHNFRYAIGKCMDCIRAFQTAYSGNFLKSHNEFMSLLEEKRMGQQYEYGSQNNANEPYGSQSQSSNVSSGSSKQNPQDSVQTQTNSVKASSAQTNQNGNSSQQQSSGSPTKLRVIIQDPQGYGDHYECCVLHNGKRYMGTIPASVVTKNMDIAVRNGTPIDLLFVPDGRKMKVVGEA